jgi:hypothetical protein
MVNLHNCYTCKGCDTLWSMGNTVYWGTSSVVVEVCYKPEGRGYETRRDELIFSIYLIFPVALGPEVYSASKRNEYEMQKKETFPGSKARPVRRSDNLTTNCEPIV